jgi:hypothetical protein
MNLKIYILVCITALFPQIVKCLEYESAECEDVYAFPKLIGRNNTGFRTEVYSLQHNEVSDRTAISTISWDTFLC